MAEQENRTRLRAWLENGGARLQPVLFSERELWETSPVPVADCANHICGFIEIKGAITPGESEAAIQRVVDRQEVLRASFLPGKDRPLQLIRATGTPLQSYRELSRTEAHPGALEDLMMDVFRQPFDLLQGPLHRVEMMRRSANDHVLAFSIHHSIADGWSLGVFVQDLSTAYVMGLKGLRKAAAIGVLGLADELPPVAQTYSEWTAAERAFWQPDELERRSAFWKSQLKVRARWEARGTLSLPRRSSQAACRGDSPGVDTFRDGTRVAERDNVVQHSAGGFELTLWKWTGRDDIVVGTPLANRNKEAIRQTMGYFSGVVPLRGRVDPARPFADHLRSVQPRRWIVLPTPFHLPSWSDWLAGHRGAGRHSIFDVRFALQNHPLPDVDLPRISTKLRLRSTGTARFDLGCEITRSNSTLEVVWLYRNVMFDAKNVRELDACSARSYPMFAGDLNAGRLH